MLKNVLHGFEDTEAIAILKNCRAVIPQRGCLLVIEFILPRMVSRIDPELEGHLMADLGMLTITGGRERSEPEWQALLEAAGFSLTRAYTIGCNALMLGSEARSGMTTRSVQHGACSVGPDSGGHCQLTHRCSIASECPPNSRLYPT
jgi:hypothetical protein